MHSGSQASSFNEPEISFNTLNQVRNVKTSTSSNNSGESSDRKLEITSTKKTSIDKSKGNENSNNCRSGDDTTADNVTLIVPHGTYSSSGEIQNTAAGNNNQLHNQT